MNSAFFFSQSTVFVEVFLPRRVFGVSVLNIFLGLFVFCMLADMFKQLDNKMFYFYIHGNQTRCIILSQLKELKCSIALLQETHLDEKEHKKN